MILISKISISISKNIAYIAYYSVALLYLRFPGDSYGKEFACNAGVVVQLFSCIQLFAIPWTAPCQAFLSFTISRSLLKLMSVESVMSSNHLICCCPCNAGDLVLIPRPGRYSGEGNCNPHQYSCLKNYMVGGAWRATVHGVAKSQI